MIRSHLLALVCVSLVASATLSETFAVAAPPEKSESPAQTTPQLPPGWTQADVQAMIEAGTPGKMQEHLVKGAGEWNCETTMWMVPDSEPLKSTGTTTCTPVMDGRYLQCEIKGEMPGMGPYHASGIYGYDNVSQEFVSTFIDNHSTGIMTGTGELSKDGKVLTWTYTHSCPITRKPAVMREVETITGPDTKTLEMFGADPKTGKTFKMMTIKMTRKRGK